MGFFKAIIFSLIFIPALFAQKGICIQAGVINSNVGTSDKFDITNGISFRGGTYVSLPASDFLNLNFGLFFSLRHSEAFRTFRYDWEYFDNYYPTNYSFNSLFLEIPVYVEARFPLINNVIKYGFFAGPQLNIVVSNTIDASSLSPVYMHDEDFNSNELFSPVISFNGGLRLFYIGDTGDIVFECNYAYDSMSSLIQGEPVVADLDFRMENLSFLLGYFIRWQDITL